MGPYKDECGEMITNFKSSYFHPYAGCFVLDRSKYMIEWLEKIKRHEKTANHIESSAVYLKWKSGKTLDEGKERELRRSSLFWFKVLDLITSTILTLTTLNLALREHRAKKIARVETVLD